MAVKSYTRQELEKKFEDRYKGKLISYKYPNYPIVYGRVDEVAFDHNGHLIIQMNNKRYSVSLESVGECVKLL